MELIVFGAGGQIGREVCAVAREAGLGVHGLPRSAADITRADEVRAALEGATIAVNCAAYTAVDRAESESEAAFAVNRDGAGAIASCCAAAGIPLIHLSTDYVFDGTKTGAWREDDAPGPLCVYGKSKLAGEVAVAASGGRAIILRTSWVFAAHGQNFVRTMLRLAGERDELRVVDDQRGGPTEAGDIAAAIIRIAQEIAAPGFDAWGVYHFSGAPPTTWYGFAGAILAGSDRPALHPITTADYPTPAHRPANSVLDCTRIAEVFGISQPDWRIALKRVLAGLA